MKTGVGNETADFPDLTEDSPNCSIINKINPTGQDQLNAFHPYGPAIYISEGLVLALIFVSYAYVVLRTSRFAPSKRRTMILWVTATPFMMALLSFIGIIVPRANAGCNYVKTLFMPWILMHLVNLTLDFHGGVTHLVPRLMQDKATLATFKSPCCCLALVWKDVPYNKKTMRIVRALVYQVPLSQFIIVFTGMVFEQAGMYTNGYLGVDDAYLWLNLLNFGTFFTAMWGVNMMIAMSAERLSHIRYGRKVQMIQFLIIFIKSQTVIFAILRAYGVISCLPPTLPAKAYKNFMENSFVIAECFIVSIPLMLEYRLRIGSHDRKDTVKRLPSVSTIDTETGSEKPTTPIEAYNSMPDHIVRSISTDELLNVEFVAYM